MYVELLHQMVNESILTSKTVNVCVDQIKKGGSETEKSRNEEFLNHFPLLLILFEVVITICYLACL